MTLISIRHVLIYVCHRLDHGWSTRVFEWTAKEGWYSVVDRPPLRWNDDLAIIAGKNGRGRHKTGSHGAHWKMPTLGIRWIKVTIDNKKSYLHCE